MTKIFILTRKNKMETTLRQKKFVRIKKSLTEAFIERLKTINFDRISIKDICNQVEVSEATFYNYFPQKIDVILYFAATQVLKVSWIIFYKKQKLDPIKKMNFLFDYFAKKMKDRYLFFEFISVLSGQKTPMQSLEISSFEKKILYPECEGIENVVLNPIKKIMKIIIQEAQEKKMIINSIKAEELSLVFHSALIGMPLSLESFDFKNLLKNYNLYLSMIWDRFKC
jgi:hypothetical protein